MMSGFASKGADEALMMSGFVSNGDEVDGEDAGEAALGTSNRS
jgi:hypothetical protein